MDTIYRLPNGELAKSLKEYRKEWDKLADIVVGFFPGYVVHGFDPELSLQKLSTFNVPNGIYYRTAFKVEDQFTLSITAIKALFSAVGVCYSFEEDR
jgi:hypothetical protein